MTLALASGDCINRSSGVCCKFAAHISTLPHYVTIHIALISEILKIPNDRICDVNHVIASIVCVSVVLIYYHIFPKMSIVNIDILQKIGIISYEEVPPDG